MVHPSGDSSVTLSTSTRSGPAFHTDAVTSNASPGAAISRAETASSVTSAAEARAPSASAIFSSRSMAAPPSPSRTRARAARRLDRICASAGTADASPGVETRRRVSATLVSTSSSLFAMLSRRAGSRTSAAIARKCVSTPEKRSSPLRPAPPATQPTEVWFGPGSWSWPMSWERWRLRLAIAI